MKTKRILVIKFVRSRTKLIHELLFRGHEVLDTTKRDKHMLTEIRIFRQVEHLFAKKPINYVHLPVTINFLFVISNCFSFFLFGLFILVYHNWGII